MNGVRSGRLEPWVEALGAANTKPALQPQSIPSWPIGRLTAQSACQAIAATLPEGAILSDEGMTSVAALPSNTAGAPRHD
jgi:acetolactate synthase-1/2/3 large subunit